MPKLIGGSFAAIVAVAAAMVGGCGGSSEGSDDPAQPPRSFFGVATQTPLFGDDLDRMAEGKVGTIRMLLPWLHHDPTAADDFTWDGMDSVVLGAAEREIEILPVLFGTPVWVAEADGHDCAPDCAVYPPRSPVALQAWEEFVAAAAERYGPGGQLWAENPEVDAVPIDAWQIWNEQNSPTFYAPKPDIDGYADLLATAEQAIHAQNPEAEIILGGMFGTPLRGEEPAFTAWEYLAGLYEAGEADSFDGIAVHPYGGQVSKIEVQIDRMRDEVEAADDDATTWITEVGWASSGPPNPLNKGPEGQAEQLEATFDLLVDRRLEWDVSNVTWYSWEDTPEDESQCDWCAGSGLFTVDNLTEPKPAWEAYVSFTGGS